MRSREKTTPTTAQRSLWIASLLLICIYSGCYKHHLYVQRQWIDHQFLASSHVNTPDPRQKNPPEGQRLMIGWDFPKSLFQQELTLTVTVRLWDQTETQYILPVQHRRDATALFFPCTLLDKEKRILTYKIEVMNRKGELLEEWDHHFWTELIREETPSFSH